MQFWCLPCRPECVVQGPSEEDLLAGMGLISLEGQEETVATCQLRLFRGWWQHWSQVQEAGVAGGHLGFSGGEGGLCEGALQQPA